MATIRHETVIAASADAVWDAVRDVGALHTRLVPGFVTQTTLDPGADPVVRTVTFATGMVLEETIVASDDTARRLVWKIDDPMVDYHNEALQVFVENPGTCRVVWTADVLPDSLTAPFGALMTDGLAIMATKLAV